MSQSKNRHQAERWLLTAEQDLQAAELLVLKLCLSTSSLH